MIMHYAGNKSFIKRHKSPPTFLQFSACHRDMHQTYPVGHLERCILRVHLICIYLYIFIMLSCRTTIGLHTALTALLLYWTRYRAISSGEKNSCHVLIFTRMFQTLNLCVRVYMYSELLPLILIWRLLQRCYRDLI